MATLGQSADKFTLFINIVKLLSSEYAISPSKICMQMSLSTHPWHFLYLCQSVNLTGKLKYIRDVLIYTSLIKRRMSSFPCFSICLFEIFYFFTVYYKLPIDDLCWYSISFIISLICWHSSHTISVSHVEDTLSCFHEFFGFAVVNLLGRL